MGLLSGLLGLGSEVLTPTLPTVPRLLLPPTYVTRWFLLVLCLMVSISPAILILLTLLRTPLKVVSVMDVKTLLDLLIGQP